MSEIGSFLYTFHILRHNQDANAEPTLLFKIRV